MAEHVYPRRWKCPRVPGETLVQNEAEGPYTVVVDSTGIVKGPYIGPLEILPCGQCEEVFDTPPVDPSTLDGAGVFHVEPATAEAAEAKPAHRYPRRFRQQPVFTNSDMDYAEVRGPGGVIHWMTKSGLDLIDSDGWTELHCDDWVGEGVWVETFDHLPPAPPDAPSGEGDGKDFDPFDFGTTPGEKMEPGWLSRAIQEAKTEVAGYRPAPSLESQLTAARREAEGLRGDLQREQEHASEVVSEHIKDANGNAIMRCTPELPKVVEAMRAKIEEYETTYADVLAKLTEALAAKTEKSIRSPWRNADDAAEIERLTTENAALTARLAEVEGELAVAAKKNAHSLANNLCPDHRDKQKDKPCLACETETLRRQLRESEERERALRECLDFFRLHFIRVTKRFDGADWYIAVEYQTKEQRDAAYKAFGRARQSALEVIVAESKSAALAARPAGAVGDTIPSEH